jgi:hypothetical protein
MKMLSLQEFVYRLECNKKPFLRYTTDKMEKERIKSYLDAIEFRD